MRALAVLCAGGVVLAGCGAGRQKAVSERFAFPPGARQIGVGPAFHPHARARRVPDCRPRLGRRYGAHVELFAANRVVLVPAGIGVGRPMHVAGAKVVRARCYGAFVTLDPTGTVAVRPGTRVTLGDLFEQWGAALRPHRLVGFAAPAPGRVRAYVAGRRVAGDPRRIVLSPHAEVVLEVGPFVPPHHSYAFPGGL